MVIVVQVISRSITIRRCRRIEWHTCFCPFYLSLSRAHYHDITISISLGMCLRLLFRLISSLPPFSLASSRTRAMKKSMAWPRETCSIVSFPSSFPLSVVVFRRLIGYTTRRKFAVLSLLQLCIASLCLLTTYYHSHRVVSSPPSSFPFALFLFSA